MHIWSGWLTGSIWEAYHDATNGLEHTWRNPRYEIELPFCWMDGMGFGWSIIVGFCASSERVVRIWVGCSIPCIVGSFVWIFIISHYLQNFLVSFTVGKFGLWGTNRSSSYRQKQIPARNLRRSWGMRVEVFKVRCGVTKLQGRIILSPSIGLLACRYFSRAIILVCSLEVQPFYLPALTLDLA